MRIYSVDAGAGSRLAVKNEAGDFIDLQKAYEAWLVASGATATKRAATRLAGVLIPDDLVALIEGGRAADQACQAAIRHANEAGGKAGDWLIAKDAAKIQAPLRSPRKFICIGLNYRAHAAESNQPLPSEPVFFNKFATSIVGPYDDVVHQGPPVTEKLDYEVELGVVIGRVAKNVSEEAAEEYVYGYTAVNDVSARDLQKRDGQWVKGKALDTYAPCGPCVVQAGEIDAANLRLTTKVNGEVRQDSNTSDLIFTVPQLIAYLSRLFTLEPGDIISTGTPAGVGGAMNPPGFINPGDVVECEVEGIGTLRNRIVGP